MRKTQNKVFSLKKLASSFHAAAQGMGQALRTEQNLRFHFITALVVGILGLWLEISTIEWLLIVICIGFVITVELLNTALEYLADVVRDEGRLNYAATKIPRDMAASAVLVSSLMAAGIGVAIFLPKLIEVIGAWF